MPTYLGALLFGLPVWLFLFAVRRDLRHKMLYMSFLVAFLAPADTFFIPEYWRPITMGRLFGLPIDIFTIVFGFFMGGVAAVLYEEIMKKTYVRTQKVHHPLRHLIALGPITLIALQILNDFNFMVNVLIASSVLVLVIVFVRRDLIVDVLLSGLFFGAIYTALLSLYIYLFPEVLTAWNLKNFPQILIGNIPHYEIVWASISGAFLGPLYEFSHDFVLRKERVSTKKGHRSKARSKR